MRIPVLRIADGNEADDAIGTLALRAHEQGIDATIVTADRDFFQLVRPGVTVMFNRKGISDIVRYDEQAVTERYGITPAQYLDFVALKGDTSDNIPGRAGGRRQDGREAREPVRLGRGARRPDRHAQGQAEGERRGLGRPARAQQGARAHRHRSRAARRPRRLRDGGVGHRRGAAPLHVARVPVAVRPAAGDRQREAEGRRGRARPARGLGRRAARHVGGRRAGRHAARRRRRRRDAAWPSPRAARRRPMRRSTASGRSRRSSPTRRRRSGRTTPRPSSGWRCGRGARSPASRSTRCSPGTCSTPPRPTTGCAVSPRPTSGPT